MDDLGFALTVAALVIAGLGARIAVLKGRFDNLPPMLRED